MLKNFGLKVALFHTFPGYLGDQIFNPNSPYNRDNCLYNWQVLRQFLSERNIELRTYDEFERRGERPSLYFFLNFSRVHLKYMVRRRIKRRQVLFWALENKAVCPFVKKFLEIFPSFFPIVLTDDDILIDKYHFRKMYVPQNFFPSYRVFWESKKKYFSAMINNNKRSNVKGELFTYRKKIIHFFEMNHLNFLDLYGGGWNQPQTRLERLCPSLMFRTNLYKCAVASKYETLSNYYYTFAIENYRSPGYITEKLFDPIFAGSVPIYYGSQNIKKYVPSECFVDLGCIGNLEALFEEMQYLIDSGLWQYKRQKGWEFINSDGFKPFSVEAFCQTVYQSLLDLQ